MAFKIFYKNDLTELLGIDMHKVRAAASDRLDMSTIPSRFKPKLITLLSY